MMWLFFAENKDVYINQFCSAWSAEKHHFDFSACCNSNI